MFFNDRKMKSWAFIFYNVVFLVEKINAAKKVNWVKQGFSFFDSGRGGKGRDVRHI